MDGMDDEWENESIGSDVEVEVESDDGEIEVDRDRDMIDLIDRSQLGDDDWLARFFLTDDEEEGDEVEFLHDTWTTTNFMERPDYVYKGTGGPTTQHPPTMRAVDFFCHLWDEAFWTQLVTETNRYAAQMMEAGAKTPRWKDVDVEEMKAFIGTVMLMGLIRLSIKQDYWRRKRRYLRTEFGTIMPRDRFFLIWRYLHLSDNTLPADGDKLRKVRFLIDTLNEKFHDAYKPHGTVTIDESMVKFKGRLSIRQYMPNKPVKWGIKVWALSESSTGYLHRFQVYIGKTENPEEEDRTKGLAHRVVTDLIRPFQFQGLRVFMDNFYTGPALLEELKMRGVLAAGTVRANRKGLPVNLLPKNLKLRKHESRVAQHNDLSFCQWQDTKAVLVLSNFHDPRHTGTVRRRTGNPQQVEVRVPKMLADYQRHMKGVDLMDQMVGYHIIQHRSRKWWRRFFHNIMQVTAHNAFIIARASRDTRKEWPTFKDFLEDLTEELIGDTQASRAVPIAPSPRPPTPPEDRPGTPVWPAIPRRHELENAYGAKRKVCHQCKMDKQGRAGATSFRCRPCDVPLHKNCFPRHIQLYQ